MRSVFPLALIAACLLLALLFSMAGMPRIVSIVPDDAAYYFGIARHAAAGDGLTFDGINRTNGFQPLWLCVLTAGFAAHDGSPETMFRVGLVLQAALLAAAGLSLAGVWRAVHSPGAALAAGAVYLAFVLVPAANGMESAVLVLCLALLLRFACGSRAFDGSSVRRAFAFGALLGLAILARLDMIFLAVSIAALSLVPSGAAGETAGARWRRLLSIAAGAAVPVAPYLAFNRASFGAVMPVSGAIKSSFPAVALSGESLMFIGKAAAGSIVLAAIYLAWWIARRPGASDGRGRYRRALAALAAACLLHFIHTILFMRWAVFEWHFIPYVLFAALLAAEVAEEVLARARASRRPLVAAVAAAAILAAGAFSTFRILDRSPERVWQVAAYRAALWARAETSPGDVFAMKDAGTFGYFSERSVINLDGVVNEIAFQDTLREGRLGPYLRRHGVRYVVQHAVWDRPDVVAGTYDRYGLRVESRKYGVESDEIELRRSDEAYRSKPFFDGPYETVFLVWGYRQGE